MQIGHRDIFNPNFFGGFHEFEGSQSGQGPEESGNGI